MSFFDPQNPGIDLNLLTTEETEFVSGLASITYVEGDILYYDGSELNRLGIGSEGETLTVSSGIPAWGSALTDTDDLPEGATSLYNQITGVTRSKNEERNDIGGVPYEETNPSGYYKDLITNKFLLHSILGVNTREVDGALGYSNGRPFVFKDGAERDVLIGIDIQEEKNKSISYEPFGSTHRFYVHSGDTLEEIGGIPTIQSYVNVSRGAIPGREVINGGTF